MHRLLNAIIAFALCFFSTFRLVAQIDKEALLQDLKILSSDEYEGRATGANEKARAYLLDQLEGASTAYTSMVDTFQFVDRIGKKRIGHNVVAKISGTKYPDHCIVLSAHYDHLGIRQGKIYNGADDNASGTAALLAMIRYFRQHPPKHSLIFAFFDAEEVGLIGARHFVEMPPLARDNILLNINLDMISRNEDNTINICGLYDFPKLAGPLQAVKKRTGLRITHLHEGPNFKGSQNWTMSSDHGPFLKKDIPFLYFGVEDHPGYHRPEDDFEFITPDFYHAVVVLVMLTTEQFDCKWRRERRAARRKSQ